MKRSSLFLMTALSIGACGDQAADSVIGTFALQMVNGKNLPYVVPNTGSSKFEVIAGLFTFRPDQSFTVSITTRITDAVGTRSVVDTLGGRWQESASTISFFSLTSDAPTSAVRVGDKLTVVSKGETWVYRR